ncbi:MAG: nitroreductase family protein [Acidimicrobiales bacterium]|nr:nitroreductase family protein [Acidimicrobiales bacterium]
MRLNLSADELLTTTRSVRKRLDLERPVERELIVECIDIAQQAPTGSNSQGWQWMVVTDPEKKKALADLYAAGFDPYIKYDGPAYGEGDPRTDRKDAVKGSATYLREHFHEVPAMVIPLQAGRADGAEAFGAASYWGSILPAVWSFMLALRERGLGSAWTTLHLPKEREAAELLGIPYDAYTQAGLFPVAYTKGTDFKPASRIPAEQLIHWDEW